jgi:Holliday junction resolvase RusA-like endonuclease
MATEPRNVAAVNAAENPLFPSTHTDIDLGLEKLRALIGRDKDPQDLVCFVHDGDPASKARARWHMKQQRFFTPQKVQDAQAALSWKFRTAVRDTPWTCNVAIVAIFFRPNAQRIDADNLMKLVMDAATKAAIWADDCQVTAQAAFIELDRERPRTIVALCPTTSTLNRDPVEVRECRTCRQPFKRNRFTDTGRSGRFCSNRCAQAAQLARARCPRCGTEFQRTVSGQRYCSAACQESAALVRRSTQAQRPWPKCEQCGNRVSRREYKRCSACSPKGRRAGSKNIPKA